MKTLLDKWKKFLITESGLSRLHGHMMKHDSAILSGFRGEYKKKDNLDRSHELKAQLLRNGYGVTKVDGSYIENFDTPAALEVSEESYFVSNKGDDKGFVKAISALGVEYEQDSVLIIPMGGQGAYLLGTRKGNDFPPLGDQITVGDLKMGGDAEFMSRVSGRPFAFADKEEEPALETYDRLSRNSKWAVKKLVEHINKRKIKELNEKDN